MKIPSKMIHVLPGSVILICTFLTGCWHSGTKPSDLAKANITGKVKMTIDISRDTSGNFTEADTILYNKNGNIVMKVTMDFYKHLRNIYKYSYDTAGNLLCEKDYARMSAYHDTTRKDRLIDSTVYVTGNNGYPEAYTTYSDDRPTFRANYDYDRKGNLTEFTLSDFNGTSKEKYKYDDKGREIQMDRYYKDNDESFTTGYDERGNIKEEDYFDHDSCTLKKVYTYKSFDKNGNWIVKNTNRSIYRPGISETKRQISYY